MKKRYHKLVRDKIPDIIKAKGSRPVIRMLDDEEFSEELKKKLAEEVKEFISDNETEELADIYEVLLAILRARNVSWDEFEKIRYSKAQERGVFEKKIFLDSIEE